MKGKILVIEDNEQNLYLVTFILERHGYQVDAAREGQEGVSRAGASVPDLILLDIQLPGMDGYAVAQRLRENPALSAVPIIAVTSYAMAGDRDRALAAGCTGYIEKPINPDTFLQQVEHHLGGPSAGGGEQHAANPGR
jgi:two-component system, cell cycle response regulator DivK